MSEVLSFLMKIDIKAEFSGKTVKEVIKKHRISARLLTRLKTMDNGILVNGEKKTVRHVLSDGDVLELAIDDVEKSEGIIPFNAPVTLLWEDEWYAAFAKPAASLRKAPTDSIDGTATRYLPIVEKIVLMRSVEKRPSARLLIQSIK